eukprot:g10230.t1
MVGKWHLGESSFRFTPLGRGFDSYSVGYLGGAEDYFRHGEHDILDFWNETNYTYEYSCELQDECPLEKYSSSIFTDAAISVLEKYNKNGGNFKSRDDKPFFLYLPMQSVHAPLEAPQDYIDSFNDTVSNPKRRIFAAMVKLLDESVGKVTTALSDFGLLEDTIIIFSTDNGGPADFFNKNMASNWPLRGMKRTLFEGGVRGVGAIRGPGINHKGAWLNELVHVADFLPSLLAHVSSSNNLQETFGLDLLPGDGLNVWDYLSGTNQTSPRTYILHEAHPEGSRDGNGAALRMGDYKIVLRSGSMWSKGSEVETNDGWYGGEGSSDPNIEGAYSLPTGKNTQPYTVKCPPPPSSVMKGFACEKGKKGAQTVDHACLFNIKDDPCEHHDLSQTEGHKEILMEMWNELSKFRKIAVDSSITKSPDGPNCPKFVKCDEGEKCNGMRGVKVPCNTP